MKWLLTGMCIVVLSCMTWITIVATLDRNVLLAGRGLWPDPWFIATLMDAYFGFLTFFVWVAYKERSWTVRSAWFVAIMMLALKHVYSADRVLSELEAGARDP